MLGLRCRMRAKNAVFTELRAKGLRLADFSAREITLRAEAPCNASGLTGFCSTRQKRALQDWMLAARDLQGQHANNPTSF